MTRNRNSQKENKKTITNRKTSQAIPAPFFENGYCRGKNTRHGFMLYNPKDFIGQTLDTYGEWAYSEISLLNQLIKPGFVILDVGANIGTHTLSFAQSVTPSGFIYAFEPQRLVFEFLCANIALNNHLNVFPLMAGVSNEPGEILVPVLDPNVHANTGSINIEGHSTGDLIQVVTIDSLKLNRCNLIKVDVEGMEENVLLGAKQTINQFRPILFVENNKPEKSENLIQLLLDLKYSCWWVFTEYLNRMDVQGVMFKPGEGFKPDFNLLCLPAEGKNRVTGFTAVLDANDTGEKAIIRLQTQRENPAQT
jgi:FkbM family methyltransferase